MFKDFYFYILEIDVFEGSLEISGIFFLPGFDLHVINIKRSLKIFTFKIFGFFFPILLNCF